MKTRHSNSSIIQIQEKFLRTLGLIGSNSGASNQNRQGYQNCFCVLTHSGSPNRSSKKPPSPKQIEKSDWDSTDYDAGDNRKEERCITRFESNVTRQSTEG